MEKWKKRAVDLLTSLLFGCDGSASVVPYYPQKTEINAPEMRFFKRVTPEEHRISSKRIYSMLCELENERRANIHNLLVLADGEVITECFAEGYGTNLRHLAHSMSKTVTGLAIGLLVSDGAITVEDKITDIFPEVSYKDKRFRNMTVKHLLTMTSGVEFAEAGSVTESDWTEAFFESPLKFTPGTEFAYNSMNSYILAKIVARVAKTTLTEFLRVRLFEPLNITNYFWEMGPEGVEKGGWGLFLSAESWAKIGYTVMCGGSFFGKRIFSEEWIREATTPHAVTTTAHGDYNYAYQMWAGKKDGGVLFNGMLGQNVWIYPKNRIVVVLNCGNNELAQISPALDIIRKYLGCEMDDVLSKKDIRILHHRETHFYDSRRWASPLEKKRGLLYMLRLRPRTAFDIRFEPLLGSYSFPPNNTGILPLFIRGMQNNFDTGIGSVSFERVGETLWMNMVDGDGTHRIELGLYEPKEAVLDVQGEKYIVRTRAAAVPSSDGEIEYRIELMLSEMPNSRMITVRRKDKDRITVTFSELPNSTIVDNILEKLPQDSPIISFLIELLEKRFGEDFIQRKSFETFNPTLVGVDNASPDFEAVMEQERSIAAAESRTVKLLRSVVDRFFKEACEEVEDDTPVEKEVKEKKRPGFISAIGRFFGIGNFDERNEEREDTVKK